jgi:cytoskeletal protein RodZ
MAAFGDTLRQARAHKGISLIEAAQATYINRYYLVALEEENFSVLPDGATFRRGIVRHYASFLGLDPNVLIRLYEETSGDRAVAAPIVNTPPPSVHGGLGYLNFSMIGVVAVLMLVGFAWFYSAYFGTSPSNDTPTQIIATLTPVDKSDLNIPTQTPVPASPTATVEPSPTSPPEEPSPTPTPTEEEVAPPPDESQNADESQNTDESADSVDTSSDETVPEDTPTEEVDESATTGGDLTDDISEGEVAIQVEALGSIYVTVEVDGTSVFDGTLEEGETTDVYTGTEIVVYTSDDSLTYYRSHTNPEGFTMGGTGEQTYSFP